MELNEMLMELRKKAQLSQDEVAEQMGVTRQTVYRWERGSAIPATENLIYLSKLYGVPMDCFVHGELPPELKPEPEPEPAPEPTPAPLPSNRRRKIITGVAVGAAAILLAILIFTGIRGKDDVPRIPIGDMNESQMTTTPDDGFGFE